ncbi:zinc knuckle protein [Trichinella spiralis]|uniref:zinc knuckle protein n=1 Tax=Trichinella spiralis TaxID=6334 RepID=UPI0001EFDBFC|nr:zinc knuckle protein [Trichinella spiralis]
MMLSAYRADYYRPPPAFRPEMDSVEWLERLEDFLCLSRVSPSDRGMAARYLLSDSVRRELYPAGQIRQDSFEEFRKRLLDAYGRQLIERLHTLHQREDQIIEQYAQEVAEIGRRTGVTERDLVARFAGGITSKEAYLAIRLQEPATLTEAQTLVSKVMRAEEDFHQRQQTRTGNPKPEKTEATPTMEDLIREVKKIFLKLEKQESTVARPAARRGGCFNCGGLGHLRRDCPHERRLTQRPPTGAQSGRPGNRRALSMAGLQTGDTPCVKVPRHAVQILQRPGDVSAFDGESAEGADVENVPRLSRRYYRLREDRRGAPGTVGRGAVPPAVRRTEDQAEEVPTDATERTLPGPHCDAAWDWYRSRVDGGGPGVAHASMRERSPAVPGTSILLRRFVRNFAGVANPFHALTKKAFARLKDALVSPSILCHPDFDRTFLVDVDASEFAIGAVLSQQGEQDPPRVVAYASR